MSFTTKPIIVPWDFSDMAKDALQQAIEIADSPEQIHVVHVTPYPAAMEPSVVWGTYSENDISEKLEHSFRELVPADKYPGLKFESYFGDPGHEIAEHTTKVDAGLIVISSHGRTGLGRLLIGSVAERVVRLAPCPVLVLRSMEQT